MANYSLYVTITHPCIYLYVFLYVYSQCVSKLNDIDRCEFTLSSMNSDEDGTPVLLYNLISKNNNNIEEQSSW